MVTQCRLVVLVALLLVAGAPLMGRAAPGDPDLDFGNAGRSQHDLPGRLESVDGIAQQADGKLVVSGGIDYLAPEGSFLVIRYLPDGALDPSFGTGGWVRTDFPGGSDFAYKILVQPDGKIVAGGVVAPGDMALTRYETDGALDSTFGVGGRVMRDFDGEFNSVRAIALQPDGKIVAAGTLDLARFLPNGDLDSTFGSGGQVFVGFEALALVVQPDGAIVVAGGADGYVVLARYDDSGVLDPGFGLGGLVITAVTGTDRARTLARQPDGKLVVGTSSYSGPGFLARYAIDGTLDASFGTGGIASFAALGDDAAISFVVVTADGIASVGQNDLSFAFFMTRHTMDGAIDGSFGARGVVRGFPGFNEKGEFELAVQSDGKLVTTFSVDPPGGGFTTEAVVARFHGGSAAGCTAPPLVGCVQPSIAGKSSLSIKNVAGDAGDALQWKWQRGPSAAPGDPIATDDYTFCLYDESGLVFQARMPAGGLCRNGGCWDVGPGGVKYKDPDRTPEGIGGLAIATTGSGQGKVSLKGRGPNLQPPTTPLALPIRAQLQGEHGVCWETTFDTAGVKRNAAGRFYASDLP